MCDAAARRDPGAIPLSCQSDEPCKAVEVERLKEAQCVLLETEADQNGKCWMKVVEMDEEEEFKLKLGYQEKKRRERRGQGKQ